MKLTNFGLKTEKNLEKTETLPNFHLTELTPCIKKIEIIYKNESEKQKAIYDATQKYEIQKTLSTKPEVGGKMVYDFALKHYKEGDEHFVLRPLSYFFVENESCLFMILVLPECKSNLKKIKKEGKLDEENIRNIIQQLYRACFYLSYLRKIRNQNLNPANILLDFETENEKVKNIKIKLTNLELSCETDKSIDSFLFGRIVCFLCLDYSDFLQLSFMPIEDEETGNNQKWN
jgi:hypothetical protein